MTAYLTRRAVLVAVATMPFADSEELSAAAEISPRTVRYVLRRLESEQLAESVPHIRSNVSRTSRWLLTPGGIERLATMRVQSPTELIRAFPISAEWRLNLLGRMDALACLYQVAREVAAGEGELSDWRWYRDGALDAAMQLSDGRTTGLMHIGSTRSRAQIQSRLRSLDILQQRGQMHCVLIVVPGQIEARRVHDLTIASRVQVGVIAEPDLMHASPGELLWRCNQDDTPASLHEIMRRAPQAELPQIRARSRGANMPKTTLSDDAGDAGIGALRLSMPAKRIMRVLFDWPLVPVDQLYKHVQFSPGHARRAVGALSGMGLVHHVRIGLTPAQRYRNEPRLCLSAAGLQHLAAADRTDTRRMLGHWRIEPDPDGDATPQIPGFSVEGSKARVLLNRERAHTDLLYAVAAHLQEACRIERHWDLEQLLPPHRSERKFRPATAYRRRYRRRLPEIKPDATALLRYGGELMPYFLEVERRATVPSRMKGKLDLYRNYFLSSDTTNDLAGLRPTVLMIYEKVSEASRFAAHASKDGGSPIPMRVSSLQQFETTGMFGRSWLDPWNLEAGYLDLGNLK